MNNELVAGVFKEGSGGCLLMATRLRQMGWWHCPESPALAKCGYVYRTDVGPYRYAGIVLYTYKVDSLTYYGSCTQWSLTPRDALRFLEHCAASSMLARYKPENPEESCLFDELEIAIMMGGLRYI